MPLLRMLTCAVFLAAVLSSIPSAARDVQIAFKRGDFCWSYVGDALRFSGKFGRDQIVTFETSGEAWFGYQNATVVKWTPRLPFLNGPNNFSISPEGVSNRIEVRLPYSGLYRFSFGPRAMEGGRGSVVICAYPRGMQPYR